MRVASWAAATTIAFGAGAPAADAPCAPHPFLPGVPGFELVSCDEAAYAELTVVVGEEERTVAGPASSRDYALREGAREPGWAELLRPLAAAVRGLGGSVTYDNGSDTAFLKAVRRGREVFTQVAGSGNAYTVTTVEAGGTPPPDPLLETLLREGRAGLAIAFVPGKPELRPESLLVLVKAAEALRGRPELKLAVEVRAREAGSPEADRALAEARARAVAAALARLGVGAERVAAVGMAAPASGEDPAAPRPYVELVRR
jgi:outer membrane protein OmpA-like peptidoglycan-associated protein